MSLQQVGGTYQGAAYPFSFDEPADGPPLLGPLAVAVSPDAALYVGCIRDSGWGGSNNVGTIVRLDPDWNELPSGIAEVQAISNGFVLNFTRPVAPELAADKDNYLVSSFTRVSTPAYGGDDQDRRSEKIRSVSLTRDGRQATIRLEELRAGYVYEIRTKNLAGAAQPFHPAEAYYTMRNVPSEP